MDDDYTRNIKELKAENRKNLKMAFEAMANTCPLAEDKAEQDLIWKAWEAVKAAADALL